MTPAHIVPEWYFLPFYAILRAIPDKLGGVLAMFAAIAVLAFLPWIDTSKVRSMSYRPVARSPVLGLRGGLRHPRLARRHAGGRRLRHRLADLHAACISATSSLCSLLGLFEKPQPLPSSIADSVLGTMKGGSGARLATATAAEPQAKG